MTADMFVALLPMIILAAVGTLVLFVGAFGGSRRAVLWTAIAGLGGAGVAAFDDTGGLIGFTTSIGDVLGHEGTYHYRGHDAPALARSATFEEVWHLLHRLRNHRGGRGRRRAFLPARGDSQPPAHRQVPDFAGPLPWNTSW